MADDRYVDEYADELSHILRRYLEPIVEEEDREGTRKLRLKECPEVQALLAAVEALPPAEQRFAQDIAYLIHHTYLDGIYGRPPTVPKPHPHPRCEYWGDIISDLWAIILNGHPPTRQWAYDDYRKALLGDPGIARRLPAAFRECHSLDEYRAHIRAKTCAAHDQATAQQSVLIDEFAELSSWLDGRVIHGSKEWIAEETYYVRVALDLAAAAISRIRALRPVVEGEGVAEVRHSRWTSFVHEQWYESAYIVPALEVAGATLQALGDRRRMDALDQPKPDQNSDTARKRRRKPRPR